MASIAGIVFNLEGPRALSDFREERLLRALEKVNSAVEAVSSRFIHFVHAEKELDAASVDRLQALLNYGPTPSKVLENTFDVLSFPASARFRPGLRRQRISSATAASPACSALNAARSFPCR